MQTVPSLIGTGTAIAAAASGLVFGQPVEPNSCNNKDHGISTIRRPSQQHRRKISFDRDLPTNARLNSSPPSRAGTNSEAPSLCNEPSLNQSITSNPQSISRPPLSRYQRPSKTHLSPKGIGRRLSLAKHRYRDPARPATVTEEGPRNSISSNGSWIKKLSIRPLSQHGSIRSSNLGLESPSITFSHGSSAPILSRPETAAQQPLPPNKLVKRSSSIQRDHPSGPAHSRSKSHFSILRRPATSHQRSATLQQFRRDIDMPHLSASASPAHSFDLNVRDEDLLERAPAGPSRGSRKTSGWISFFHSRALTISGGGMSSRLGESQSRGRSVSGKRISATGDERRVHLLKPRMVSSSSAPAAMLSSSSSSEPEEEGNVSEDTEDDEIVTEEPRRKHTQEHRSPRSPVNDEATKFIPARSTASPEIPPTGRAKRSIPTSFAPAGTWVSRTSGSLRRPKRGDAPVVGVNDKRHVSAPMSGAQIPVDQSSVAPVQSTTTHPILLAKQGPALTSAANVQPPSHKRNHSSPLPPLPRISSFHVDSLRLGSAGGAAIHIARQNQPSGSSTSSAAMSQRRVSPLDRSSLVDGSESDARGFTSGDDDDADLKSETMYDSLRTAASSRMRAVETPLESVYDESPPSSAGHGRTKRFSIQEMLDSAHGSNRIMEEDGDDEGEMTANRARGGSRTRNTNNPTRNVPQLGGSLLSRHFVTLTSEDPSRPSLDDDFDEHYWDEEDAPMSPLSPPSKSSSLNSRGIHPNVRHALAGLHLNDALDASDQGDARSERPLSTLYDWSEPSVADKNELEGFSTRPKTAHGKENMDFRGGRPALRKGPALAHIRSQSVPVFNEAVESTKSNGSKFSTWGMGSKAVSEDWDEDFEFGINEEANDAGEVINNNQNIEVPESIRASQPSVRAHSGQIRELSLLVDDLKRLYRHGRNLDMLKGPYRELWKEAEGVIALASPDEDSEDEAETQAVTKPEPRKQDREITLESRSLGRLDSTLEGLEPNMSRTAVVRERLSPKRRSVFAPDDDIFGGNWQTENDSSGSRSNRPKTPRSATHRQTDSSGVARSVMEAMHRSSPSPVPPSIRNDTMHFDTNSLKVLVKKAGELRDSLAEVIRKEERITQSPAGTPRYDRPTQSSPAFTRVFDDPGSSPPRHTMRSRGTGSIIVGTPPSNSSSRMGQRLQPMTVN